jgi:hypothetical protein
LKLELRSGLTRDSKKITGLENFHRGTVILNSTEVLINRNNSGGSNPFFVYGLLPPELLRFINTSVEFKITVPL